MSTSRNNSANGQFSMEGLESRQMFAAVPGTLDPSFGVGGKFSLRIPQSPGTARLLFAEDVAVQADGKTIVAATFVAPNGGGQADFALVRLNFDGTLDKTFGPENRGFVIQHLGEAGQRGGVSSVAIQQDGKIVVAGFAVRGRIGPDTQDIAVARFLSNGQLDRSFDNDGMRFIEFGDSHANDIAIQKDGKIVVVGTKGELFPNFDEDFAVARLNSNGSLDSSFDKDGKKTIGLGELDEAHSVVIEENGKIIIAGESGEFTDSQIALVRLKADGSADTTFGSGGTVRTRLSGIDESQAKDVLLQPGGKILVLAEIDQNFAKKVITPQMGLVRYDFRGQLDTTFGGAGQGVVISKFGGIQFPDEIISSPRGGGGLIASSYTDGKFTLTSFTPNGVIDSAFGNNGRTETDFGADGTAGSGGIAIGPNQHRIVMVGGDVLKTARYFDHEANVVSLIPFDGSAREGGADNAVFTVTRSERLPVPTRVFFNLSGSAINNLDYTTNLTRVFERPPLLQIGTGPVIPRLPAPGDAFIDIPAGANAMPVNLSALKDAGLEGVEIASFSIAPNAAYSLGQVGRTDVAINDGTSVFVNFQAPGPVPTSPLSYVGDFGQAFGNRGNGLSYGWDADNTANVRTRNNPGSPDARFDTLALLQKDGANRKWEIAVPNGMYSVQLDVGDPSFTDSVYKLNLENKLAISGTPGGNIRWFEGSFNVLVSDGRLTLSNAAGAINNKVAFIHIVPAAPGAVEGPTSPVISASLVTPPTIKTAAPVVAARIFSDVRI
jgi:uncharacterized delta-60 repeat protein